MDICLNTTVEVVGMSITFNYVVSFQLVLSIILNWLIRYKYTFTIK